MSKSPYEILRKINVQDHIEKKGNLSYLSWTWAMDEVKKLYPKSFAKMNKTDTGMSYFTDGMTCWIDVEYHLIDEEGTEYVEREPCYPIMDYKNKSIPADKVTSFDVNTAYQRGVTKCIARHGLGLYIYAGEDLPPSDDQAVGDNKPNFEKNVLALDKLERELKKYGFDRHDEGVITYVTDKAKIKYDTLDNAVIGMDNKATEKVIKVYEELLEVKKKQNVEVPDINAKTQTY